MATNWSSIVKGNKILAAEFNVVTTALKNELNRRSQSVSSELNVVAAVSNVINSRSAIYSSLKEINSNTTLTNTAAGNIISKDGIDQVRAAVNVHENVDTVGTATSCGAGCTGLCAGCTGTCTGGCTSCRGCTSCSSCTGGCSGCNGRYF